MDYTAVTAFAYFSAAALSLILTLFLVHSGLHDRWKLSVAIGAAVQTVWLTALSASLSNQRIDSGLLLFLESSHYLAWILALTDTLRRLRPEAWPTRFKISLAASVVIYALSIVHIVTDLLPVTVPLLFMFLLLAFLALSSVEQLVRNANSGRFMKLLGVSLALVFIFDIYLYAQGIINRRVDLVLWQARAALLMASSFLVVSAGLLFRGQKDSSADLGLSRPVAFYYTSLLLTSVCAIVLAIGGYYVRNLGGHWGIFLFTLMLFFSLAALSALFLSNRIRKAIQVWVSKHFFHHKYDYRREWLNVIQQLSDLRDDGALYETVYASIANTFQANCGEVRVLRGGQFQQVYRNVQWQPGPPPEVFLQDSFIQIMQQHEWVFLPQAREGELAYYNETLPDWVRAASELQLIVPLIAQNTLVGFVALGKDGVDPDLSWEDLDILKTMGRQLANHILIHTQREQLSEARQLETYNKLSAFIMHDLNNVVAQLGLVVKNAERHKRNPAFVDDMLLTVGNAATRMNSLIQKLNRPDHQNTSRFSLHKAIAASIETCSASRPKPTLCVKAPDRNIQADWDRFILAFKHLIKNAQEATTENGKVQVSIESSVAATTTVSIIDDGAGMSQAFIDNQLFKPFATTKTGQGMGIGVYLTRSYLEELGANLQVRSQPGKGTEITVTFGATME